MQRSIDWISITYLLKLVHTVLSCIFLVLENMFWENVLMNHSKFSITIIYKTDRISVNEKQIYKLFKLKWTQAKTYSHPLYIWYFSFTTCQREKQYII